MNKKQLIFFLVFFSFLLKAQNTTFELCGDKKLVPYYFDGLPYKTDFYEVKQYFKENYSAEKFKNIPNNTGMIHIVFHVNCKGETGNYSIETFDYDYKYCTLNEELKNEFLRLTKELKIFQPFTPNDKIQNFHKFYIFKLKNRELIEIAPK